MKTYNFVYKTIFYDGRYYIGQHKTDNLNDNYFGSSRVVKDLVKQGINCNREILRYCSTQKELNYWEKYYIGDNWKNDPLCLNEHNVCCIIEWTDIMRKKQSESHKGKHHSEETKKKMSESHKGENHPLYDKHHSEETKKKMSESHKGENHYNYGKHHSELTKQKMRKPKTEETKQKMRKPKTAETKKKIGAAKKGKHRVYDNIEKTKWHFE